MTIMERISRDMEMIDYYNDLKVRKVKYEVRLRECAVKFGVTERTVQTKVSLGQYTIFSQVINKHKSKVNTNIA